MAGSKPEFWFLGSRSVKSVMHPVDWPYSGGYILVLLEYDPVFKNYHRQNWQRAESIGFSTTILNV
jgi:hypothetical protein